MGAGNRATRGISRMTLTFTGVEVKASKRRADLPKLGEELNFKHPAQI